MLQNNKNFVKWITKDNNVWLSLIWHVKKIEEVEETIVQFDSNNLIYSHVFSPISKLALMLNGLWMYSVQVISKLRLRDYFSLSTLQIWRLFVEMYRLSAIS
jgi:hypothetical protein